MLPHLLPLTALTAPSPGLPGLPAEEWAGVRTRRDQQQNTTLPRAASLGVRGLLSNPPRPEPQFPRPWLTPRSSMSSVTTSSASNCTEESAFTVTEPLLTVEERRCDSLQATSAQPLPPKSAQGHQSSASPVYSQPPVQCPLQATCTGRPCRDRWAWCTPVI